MAQSRKSRRTSRSRGHLVDVSTIAEPTSDHEPWLTSGSSTAVEDGAQLAVNGRFLLELDRSEYKEYLRLKEQGKDDGSPANDPSASGAGADAGQDLGSFIDHLGASAQQQTPSAHADGAEQAAEPDPFFDGLRYAPDRPVSAASERSGSAALEGIAAIPTARTGRGRLRSRALMAAAALVVIACGCLVLLHPHSSTGARSVQRSASSRAVSRLGEFSGFTSTLAAISSDVRAVGGQERAALAHRAHQRTVLRRRVEQQERAKHAAHAKLPTRSSPTDATAPSSASTETETTTAPPATTTSDPGSSSSTGTSTSSASSSTPATHRHSHPFGVGGVLGAGHSGDSS